MSRLWILLGFLAVPYIAAAQEQEVAADDSHMQLAPRERLRANNPSAEHVAFMEALTAENVSAETARQNELENARRMAVVDLHWGLP